MHTLHTHEKVYVTAIHVRTYLSYNYCIGMQQAVLVNRCAGRDYYYYVRTYVHTLSQVKTYVYIIIIMKTIIYHNNYFYLRAWQSWKLTIFGIWKCVVVYKIRTTAREKKQKFERKKMNAVIQLTCSLARKSLLDRCNRKTRPIK